MTYELIYWPHIPGRGEFVRLVLEAAGLDYVDRARLAPDTEAARAIVLACRDAALNGVSHYAPPVLRCGDFSISQTGVICSWLGERHGLAGATELDGAYCRQLVASVLDVVDEAHNTHHPVSTSLYFEEQREAAIAAARAFVSVRLPGWLRYFERTIGARGGPWLLGATFTYPDLALFHLIAGLRYAFPRAMAELLETGSPVDVLCRNAASRPSVAAYLASERRLAFNEHGIFRAYPELDLRPAGV